MKRTASAVEISAAKSAASARPPSHGGSTSVVSRGRASSGFARPGSTARIAMPNTTGHEREEGEGHGVADGRGAARRAAERAAKHFWIRPGETMNDGTKTTARPRMPGAGPSR